MKSGRPTKSEVRDNIVQILRELKKAHGYVIYKEYIKRFPKTTLRSIYYNLKKGMQLGLFEITERDEENFTIIYSLKGGQ